MSDALSNYMEFPLRVNISFMLCETIHAHVLSLNRLVVDAGYNEICFSGPDAVMPHITLLMGEVDTEDEYDLLAEELRVLAETMYPIQYRIGRPYLRQPSQHFIFVDVHPERKFRDYRVEMHADLGRYIECDHHGGPHNVSHITIGYCPIVYPGLQELVRKSNRLPGIADTIQLSVAGKRGTCVKKLHEFRLRDPR